MVQRLLCSAIPSRRRYEGSSAAEFPAIAVDLATLLAELVDPRRAVRRARREAAYRRAVRRTCRLAAALARNESVVDDVVAGLASLEAWSVGRSDMRPSMRLLEYYLRRLASSVAEGP